MSSETFRNTLSSTLRSVITIASVATSSLLLLASATPAFAGAPAYRLVPVAAISATETVVVRDVLWKCAETGCVAKAATSRPAIVCATAAREIGKISAFSANGKDFTAEELAACNTKAK
jgi:hypothetical protein